MKRLARLTLSMLMFTLRIALPPLILAAGVAGFYHLKNRPKLQARVVEAPTAPLVQTATVQSHNEGLDLQTDGVVVPFREVELSSEVEGRITFKAESCRAGNYITAGTLLFQIDSRDYDLEVQRLKKELAQAEASLRELDVETGNTDSLIKLAKEELAFQQKELTRIQDLAKRRVATESAIDTAKRNELAARNSLLTLTNQLQLQKTRRDRLITAREIVGTQLEKAGLALTRTKIIAPINGVIIADTVEQDSYVRAGVSLVRINDSSAAEVKCKLKMEELSWIWNQAKGDTSTSSTAFSNESAFELPETPVTVVYKMLGRDFSWEGKLSRYEGTGLDLATRTVPCRVIVNDPRNVRVSDAAGQNIDYTGPRALVTGMFVTVLVHTQPTTRLLSVPEQAVRPGNRIWVLRDGKLNIQKVQPAETIDGRVILPADASHFKAGDRVVVSTLPSAESGMAVREEELAVSSRP